MKIINLATLHIEIHPYLIKNWIGWDQVLLSLMKEF